MTARFDVPSLGPDEAGVDLVPLSADDGDLVVAWRRRPDVARWMFSDPPETAADHVRWVERATAIGDRMEWIIRCDGVPVGTIGLSSIDPDRRQAEYGILLGSPEARGRGTATAASVLLLEHAFAGLALEQVELRVDAANLRAHRLYERLGFRDRDRMELDGDADGREVVVMTLSTAAWQAERRRG